MGGKGRYWATAVRLHSPARETPPRTWLHGCTAISVAGSVTAGSCARLTRVHAPSPLCAHRCHQGLLNEHLAVKLVTQSAFRNEAVMTFNGSSAVSSNKSMYHYFGNSQGGILGLPFVSLPTHPAPLPPADAVAGGGAPPASCSARPPARSPAHPHLHSTRRVRGRLPQMATSTDIVRGVSGVGGGPYSLLLPRSSDFSDLFLLLRLRYTRPLDQMCLLAAMQVGAARVSTPCSCVATRGHPTPLRFAARPYPPPRLLRRCGTAWSRWATCTALAATPSPTPPTTASSSSTGSLTRKSAGWESATPRTPSVGARASPRAGR